MRKILVKTVSWLLCAVLLAGIACPDGSVSQAAKVKLNKSSVSLKIGETVKLKVKNYKKKVKWASSNKKVAKVTAKGVVKAKAAGKTTITAKAGKKKMKCKVTVSEDESKKQVNQTDTTTSVNTPAPANTPDVTQSPTNAPEPTATPKYMQEGAFVYDKLDISWIDPNKPMVAFTFDDGPVGSSDTSYSMRIQKALKEYNFHATFNYVTEKLGTDDMNNEILTAMENGHEVANHTSQWTSLSDTQKFPDGQAVADEIEKSRKALSDLTGISDFTLRPPNLGVNAQVQDNCNVPLIGCSIDSKDWDKATKEQIISNVERAKDGDIVLMHETYATTADVIEELVQYFAEQGYQIVSVSELFAAKDIPLFAGNYYNKAEYMEPRN